MRFYDRILIMGILLGLVAAVGWGAADFFARYATQRIGAYLTLFFMQFTGMVALSLYLFSTGQLQFLLAHTSWSPWAWVLLSSLLNIVSSLALYRAFEIGTLTIVSPIAASYAVITVVLAFFSGEALTFNHDIALILVFCGIIAAATPFIRTQKNIVTPQTNTKIQAQKPQSRTVDEGLSFISSKKDLSSLWKRKAFQGIVFAIVASIGYGCAFWILGFRVTPILGGIIPVWISRTVTPCVLFICAPMFRQPFKLPRGSTWWFLAGVSILDTVAFVSYTFGTTRGQLSIVTMLSSLYSIITVVLAWFFLRERLQWNQWLGIGIVFAGIVLVNV